MTSERENRRRVPNIVAASNMLEAFFWGDPGETLPGVRAYFSEIITFSNERKITNPVLHLPQEFGACVALGLNPYTGEPLEDPAAFIASIANQEINTDLNTQIITRTYTAMTNSPRFQAAVAEERIKIEDKKPPYK